MRFPNSAPTFPKSIRTICVFYFVCVTCLPAFFVAQGAAATKNVIVVLDDSGSMNEPMATARMTRMLAAKRALLKVLEILPDDTHVGIVLLNGRVRGEPWLIPLGPVNLSNVESALNQVQAGGGTPLGKFMKVAADALLNRRGKDHYGAYRLLLVTDGEASDPRVVNNFLPDILSRGLTVDVIGVDMDEAHSLATKVHSYRQADNPESLTTAVSEVFAETTASPADAGESDFELLEAFPDGMAVAALDALSTGGNAPIGGTRATAESRSERSSGTSGSSSSRKQSKENRRGMSPIVLIVLFLLFINVFSKIVKNVTKR